MLIQEHLVLTRSEPNGNGGTQFVYRINDYGITAVSPPMEEIAQIHWQVEVVKFHDKETLNYEICHKTELADKTLIFKNDKSLNEFLQKSFDYFKELNKLEGLMES